MKNYLQPNQKKCGNNTVFSYQLNVLCRRAAGISIHCSLLLGLLLSASVDAKESVNAEASVNGEIRHSFVSDNERKMSDYLAFEVGTKLVNKAVKGVGTQHFDVRPYIQLGAYRQHSAKLKVGTAINFAPNTVSSDTPGLLNFKVLDLHYQLTDTHAVSVYGGALRQARKYTAWGYSIGFGYGFKLFEQNIKTNISWARTNTDIGGRAADTGAKDNIVWLNLGVSF